MKCLQSKKYSLQTQYSSGRKIQGSDNAFKIAVDSIKHSYICGEDMMLLFGHWKGLGKSLNFIFGWLLLQIGNRVDFSICILCEITWNIFSHLDETEINSEVMSNLFLTTNKMATKLKTFVTNTIWSRKKNSALK